MIPFIFVVLLSIFVSPSYSQNAQYARIDNVVISNNPQNIQVSFDVKDGFTKDIENAIKSGIPTTFTLIIELYRERSLWFNEKLSEVEFKHTVKYDTLKAEYEVLLEEKVQPDKAVIAKDLSKVKELMTKVEGMPFSFASSLQKGNRYKIKIKAKMDTVNLFFPLNYMLFFVSFWDFETDWYEQTIVF